MSAPSRTKLPRGSGKNDVLHHALRSASRSLLLQTLGQICTEVPAARELIAKKLLTTEDRVRLHSDLPVDSSDVSAAAKANPPAPKKAGVKRWRSRYAMCKNCGEEYDVEHNYDSVCAYHPGRDLFSGNCTVLICFWFFRFELIHVDGYKGILTRIMMRLLITTKTAMVSLIPQKCARIFLKASSTHAATGMEKKRLARSTDTGNRWLVFQSGRKRVLEGSDGWLRSWYTVI